MLRTLMIKQAIKTCMFWPWYIFKSVEKRCVQTQGQKILYWCQAKKGLLSYQFDFIEKKDCTVSNNTQEARKDCTFSNWY